MNAVTNHLPLPIVRKDLNFRLEEVPRFWFDNDPFRTRIFDALSLTFPDGERYFIQCVRLFQDQIQEPELASRVKDFIRQEAQHGISHDKMNKILIDQGMPIEKYIRQVNQRFKHALKRYPNTFNIAITASCEHLTALMATTFFSEKSTMQGAHPFVRALFAWHSIEEMEHRDVAYDVMVNVAKTPTAVRYTALILVTMMMFGFTMQRTNGLLKRDGFTRVERIKMFGHGLKWLIGRKGILTVKKQEYLDWFRPNFHPNQHPVIQQYQVWIDALANTQDPIHAGEAFWQAAN